MRRVGHDLREHGITEARLRMVHDVFQESVAFFLELIKSPVIDQRVEARRARIIEALNLKVLLGRPLFDWPLLKIFLLMQFI